MRIKIFNERIIIIVNKNLFDRFSLYKYVDCDHNPNHYSNRKHNQHKMSSSIADSPALTDI